MASSTALGQYLRARRELVRPEDVSLPNVGRRRVPGLRREELAMLAGISSDYYLRLEQGRDHHPSAHVIDALARALQLDEDATAHLHRLAQPAAARPRTEESERAPDSVIQLIAWWSDTPAFVRWLPGAVVHGVSAGIQLYVELPTGCDEAATVEAAAQRGVAVEGVGRLRISRAGPGALVLGFARLPEHRLADAVRLLAEALTEGR